MVAHISQARPFSPPLRVWVRICGTMGTLGIARLELCPESPPRFSPRRVAQYAISYEMGARNVGTRVLPTGDTQVPTESGPETMASAYYAWTTSTTTRGAGYTLSHEKGPDA